MSKQPEQVLEDNLVKQLNSLNYSIAKITNEEDLLANLKAQLEKHNEVTISDKEFTQVLNKLNKGNVFERAKILRDKAKVRRDNGEVLYIEFINQEYWCKNQFQVTQQVSMEGSYKNRYDVTLLINGLPLVQIELKRRGLELKEAFNQTNRYQRHSYGASYGLFQYIQIFIISNGVNTKYYANNRRQSFKQTFFWADKNNKIITKLEPFAKQFLEPCHIAKMITRYTVLNQTAKILMVLRPYQYYASEAIIDRVKNTHKNGYIWHTTGSGKTLTSFKASQILTKVPKVHKVVFVVDRKDLDYQTNIEFNSYSKGSVDGTNDTKSLVKQFGNETKLIVTTIQKLNTAISKNRYNGTMEKLKDKRIVFIFDECHRSQFGETHKRITSYFNKSQLFGFTGTPIFEDNATKNAQGKRTTKDLFDKCLHKYVITDAIKDENVLKFSIEYVGRYKRKDDSQNELDIEVEDIDTKELLESEKRLEKISDYILANHARKTHNKTFTAMFCVSSIETLIKYYEILKARKEEGKHNLRIATIFSYTANEEDKDADGFYFDDEFLAAADPVTQYRTDTIHRVSDTMPRISSENNKTVVERSDAKSLSNCRNDIEVESEAQYRSQHSREKLDEFIADYNAMFNTKFSTKDSKSFYNYYNDISKKVKGQKVDILLVVNMFLTGFDSPALNTLYVDKNLKQHGLIQAFSRTNRIINDQKSQGNIVCFRNLKNATDDAITLFSNKEAKEDIIIEPYEEYIRKFGKAFGELLQIAPTVNSVNDLKDEEKELEFIKAFRELMRLKNVLTTFADFSWSDLAMNEQAFEDYKSKYLDLYDKAKTNHQKEKVSILEDVDFELELIHRDEINVAYILQLLAKLKDSKEEEIGKQRKAILDILSGEAQLRSKKELIEKFIDENLPHIEDNDDIPEQFDQFWDAEKKGAFLKLCKDEQLAPQKFDKVISDYIFTQRKPLRDDILDALEVKPKILQRKPIIERVTNKVLEFVETFISGIAS